jgi:DNA-directed RNA polymerase specialized sigma24 family protein
MTNEELSRLLTEHYPLVHRVARGLCGDAPAAAIEQKVFAKSLTQCEHWRDEDESRSWFLHHTILNCRNIPSPAVISWLGESAERIEIRAMLKAFLALPFQQREAFLLSRGEKMNLQQVAVAMDCSKTAAANHLSAAEKLLNLFAGPEADKMIGLLLSAYTAPPPPGNLIIPRTVRRSARRKFFRRLLKLILLLLVAAAIWWGWQHRQMLDH